MKKRIYNLDSLLLQSKIHIWKKEKTTFMEIEVDEEEDIKQGMN